MAKLSVAPLSAEEKAWCKKLEKVLMATPARLGLSSIGDRCLDVFDEMAVETRGVDIADGGAEQAGVSLSRINCRVRIHAIAG